MVWWAERIRQRGARQAFFEARYVKYRDRSRKAGAGAAGRRQKVKSIGFPASCVVLLPLFLPAPALLFLVLSFTSQDVV